MQYQFDNTVTLNDQAIPFFVRKIDNKDYYYIYAHGVLRFQCPRLRKSVSTGESALMYAVSQRNKKNKSYYAKFMGKFEIEEKTFYLMKIFFKYNEEKEWDTWLIPREFTQRINAITYDFDDRS